MMLPVPGTRVGSGPGVRRGPACNSWFRGDRGVGCRAAVMGSFFAMFVLAFVDSNLDTKALNLSNSGRGGRRLSTSKPCIVCRPSKGIHIVDIATRKRVRSAACAMLPRSFALRIASRGKHCPFSIGLRPIGHPR